MDGNNQNNFNNDMQNVNNVTNNYNGFNNAINDQSNLNSLNDSDISNTVNNGMTNNSIVNNSSDLNSNNLNNVSNMQNSVNDSTVKQKTNKNAILSIVFSVVSIFIFCLLLLAGISTGFLALKEIKAKNEKGKVLAIIGIVVGIVGAVLKFCLDIIGIINN